MSILATAGSGGSPFLYSDVTVGIVIPTYNQARFLGDAIASALTQTRPPDQVIVVDDGSTDGPASVVTAFPSVRLIRQDNRGLAAARNTGLHACHTTYIVFLDADDRLLPGALEAGLACFTLRPDCGFVYGGYRRIGEDGSPFGSDVHHPIEGNGHIALLKQNIIQMHATVLYKKDCLLAVHGFDERLRRLEDHDVYLRVTQKFCVASHPTIVAEYRKHNENMSDNYAAQLAAALEVLDRHEARLGEDGAARAALQIGRANKRGYYVAAMLAATLVRWREQRSVKIFVRDLAEAARWSPRVTIVRLLASVGRRSAKMFRQTLFWTSR